LSLNQYVNQINNHYIDEANLATRKKERLILLFETDERYDYQLNEYKNIYFNENLSDLVRNINVKDRILETKDKFVQRLDIIYHIPEKADNPLNYRAPFYSPQKHFLGQYIYTPYFNIGVIWFMTLFLYFTVYFKVPEKTIRFFGKYSN